ncbi:MAG: ATP-binding cassette domain-containing protein [Desulfobacterium sp.]
MTPLITLSQITKSYGHVSALEGIDMTLHKNEILGIIGDNGAGKSTLIKILSGVEKFDSSQMFFSGKPISSHTFSVIFISHNLHHVHEVADRFLFIQHGKVMSEVHRKDASPEILIETLMKCS